MSLYQELNLLHLLEGADLDADRVNQIWAIVDAILHSFFTPSISAVTNLVIYLMIFASAINSVKGVVHSLVTYSQETSPDCCVCTR
jgi:hypothetical protein